MGSEMCIRDSDVNMGASVQLSMMIVQIAIVLSGSFLLRMNNFTEAEEDNGESSAVKIIVSLCVH